MKSPAASTYGFFFDASCCTGCKACQAACKDRNGLPAGLLWRRVYEISGGGWQARGAAWISSVFAYHVSIACNHCRQPICAEVCPAAAITRRPDGIVLLDSRRCLGCGYCSWACPYGAPQYDRQAGHMTKCHFCVDAIDRGELPSCVAACPMRALDVAPLEELRQRPTAQAVVAPLPDPQLTDPALRLQPPKPPAGCHPQPMVIANREEVNPR